MVIILLLYILYNMSNDNKINMKLVYRLEDEIIDKDKQIKKLKSEITKYKNLLLTIHKQI